MSTPHPHNHLPQSHPLHGKAKISVGDPGSESAEVYDRDTGQRMSLVQSVDLEEGVIVQLREELEKESSPLPEPFDVARQKVIQIDDKTGEPRLFPVKGNWGIRPAS